MKITTFNAIKNRNKKPKSPYDPQGPLAQCFEFKTQDVNTMKECFEVLVDNWVLTNSICIDSPITCTRHKKNLNPYRCESPGCVLLDIDKIKSYDAMTRIIKFFKDSDFNVILGKSKNWDGQYKFNLKGFIQTEFTNEWTNSRNFMSILDEMIGSDGEIDISASSDTSVQAPLFRNEILLQKLDSDLKVDDDWILMNRKIIKTKQEDEFIQQVDTSKMIQLCYEIYMKKGFSVCASRGNDTINWEHPSEVKSKGGYFTYVTSPHIMHHNNKDKSINIFNEIRQTKEGQEFIKEQTAYALKKQFEEHKKTYKNELMINQPLIEINEKMKKFLKKFLHSGDILKVKSAMGTGKSWIIDEIINECRELDQRVLLVSNRISVANDYANKYNIKTYQVRGDDAWQKGEDLIVQLDSLWKYDLRDFDIVILDEFVSLMFQTIGALKDEMRPFNAAKLYHALKNKKCVIADAFISGYEDRFYGDKNIFYIQNNHRDNVNVSYYDKRDVFVDVMLETLDNKKEDENITASIMSNDVINAIYDLATKKGYKVFKLTGNTSEETKKTIYKLFEDDVNDKWDLLLYSPTLTVGVSNMNNCTHHFHYDTGNAADVISSLQMVKRTRKMKHLHLFLKEKVKLEPTDDETLNDLFNQNIDRYFKGQANGITIQVDENANFVLSDVGMFMNKIQAFYNQLENNHKLSFNVLLGEQFRFKEKNEIKCSSRLKFGQCIKETKQRIKEETIDMISKYSHIDYSENITELLNSRRTLSDEEKVKIILHELEQKVNTTDKNVIEEIAKAEIMSDYKLTQHIKNLVLLYRKDILFINNYIDNLLTSGTKSNEFKDEVNFLKDITKLFNYKLKNWYSENEIKQVEEQYELNNFKKVLKRVGYTKKTSRYVLNNDVINYLKYFI